MNNVREYTQIAQGYRDGLREIWARYEKRYDALKGFEGKRHDDELREAQDDRDKQIKTLQHTTASQFDTVLRSMRENLAHAPMQTPTSDQMAVLQALKMRESVSQDELVKAAEQMRGVDVAVSVLAELAAKNGHPHVLDGFMGAAGRAEASINELTSCAKLMVKLTRPDGVNARMRARRFRIHGGEFDARHEGFDPYGANAKLSLSAVDRDIKDERMAMREFGNVKDFDEFRSLVNRSPYITEQAQRQAGEI